MASSLFGNPQNPTPQQSDGGIAGLGGGSILQMLQKFSEFKQMMQGKDPEKIVSNLLASGQMTREQFEELAQLAHTLEGVLK